MKKSIKILNESIQDIKKLVWPNLSMHDVVRFMKFSPSWEPLLENIEIETELSSELYKALISELDSLYNEYQISNRKQYIDINPINLSSNNNIKLTGDKKLIDGLKIVAANIKLDKILQKVSDEEILVNGTKEQQVQIFSLFNVMKNDINTADELINLSNSVINLMQQMKDKSLSPDDKKTVITNMKQTGSNLKTKLDTIIKTELTQDEQTEFDKLIPSTNNSVSKYKITGFYHCVIFIFDLITSINNNQLEVKHINLALQSDAAAFCRILYQPSMISSFIINNYNFLNNQTLSKFNEKAKLISDVDEQTRWIIKICNDELTRSLPQNREALIKNIEFEEQKLRKDLSQEERIATETSLAKYRSELDLQVFNTPEELELYLKQNNIGFLTRLYNKKLFEGRAKIKEIVTNINKQKSVQEKLAKIETKLLNAKDNDEKKQIRIVINKIRDELTKLSEKIPTDLDGNINFDEEAERKKLPTDLMSYKTLFSLKNAFDNFLKKNYETHIISQSNPQLKTNCARRRMKLFTAAERRGAIIYKCNDWVLAALPTAKATQPFGRYRPKVDTQGRIKDECNLETWEGITPENKKIRDSRNYPYIKDSLYNECAETIWCTSGWGHLDERQWDNIEGPAHRFNNSSYTRLGALIAFMDCSTGYLYQYGNGELLDETDCSGGILKGINSMRQLLIKYPSLLDAIVSAGFTKYLRPEDKIKSQGLTINELMQSGLMLSSGSVKIKSSNDFNKILPIIDFIDEIVLDVSCDTSQVFRKLRDNNKIVALPAIDLNNIKKVSHLFENITISNTVLKLKNTGNITHAISMFKNLKFQTPSSEIVGLDTKNVINANEMFALCRNTQFRNVSIPDLDFSNCKYMNNAFTSSGISGIKFKKGTNTDKVVSAIDAFKNCFMLENMPNVLFKSIKHGKNLVSNFTQNYASIFDGCNTLIKKYRSQPSTNNKDGDKFDDIIDAIKNFYEDPEQTKLSLDSRGYAIVNSPEDAIIIAPLLSRRDIKGIVIGKNASIDGLFNGLDLNIKSLDINGHASTYRMFINCNIHEFNEIIGTENIVDATEMFYGTECNIYPKINLPKCKNFKIFSNANSPRTIPEIEYGNDVSEIEGVEFNLIQNGIPPADDGYRIANNICDYMFDNTDSAWIKDHDLTRLVDSLYTEHIRKIKENILESIQKDDRDYYIINENLTQGLILTLINNRSDSRPVAGFVFDSEYVKKLNSKNESPAFLFSKISVNYMPIIDFNGLQNCSEMFYQSKITRFEGFEHTDSIINASNMFYRIETQQVFPIFNSKNLKFANNMFFSAQLNNGFSSKFDFSSLVDASNMFSQLLTSNLPFENNLNLPNVENANNMFNNSNTRIVTNINIDTINMPKCKTATEMFNYCKKITSIKTINIGQNASDVNLHGLFIQCSNLIKISNINIPTTINCGQMFYYCNSLKNIGQFNAPHCINLERTFAKCPVFSSICIINVPSTTNGINIFANSKLQYVYGKDGKALFARMALLGK